MSSAWRFNWDDGQLIYASDDIMRVDRQQFVRQVRVALAQSIERRKPLQLVRLREARAPKHALRSVDYSLAAAGRETAL